MEQFDLRRLAEPYMLKLRDLTGQTMVLSIPASGDALVNAVCESPQPRDHLGQARLPPARACVGAGAAHARIFAA